MGPFSCPKGQEIWDGVDFSPCFKDRILGTLFPLVLVVLSSVVLLSHTLYNALSARFSSPPVQLPTLEDEANHPAHYVDDSISPRHLENTVIRDAALAGFGAEPEEPRSFVEKLAGFLALALLVGLLGVELARAVQLSSIPQRTAFSGGLAFAAYLVLLAALAVRRKVAYRLFGIEPGALEAHRISLEAVYLVLSLVSFRSALIAPKAKGNLLNLDAVASALVFAVFLVDTLVPYRSQLDGALAGHYARGRFFPRADKGDESVNANGSSSTSAPFKRPPTIEEPRSLAGRALFSYLNAPIYRHFFTPIEEKDVPALREDDQTASVVGGWREFMERERRGLNNKDQLGDTSTGSLSWKLLVYFKGYFALQAFWSAVFVLATYLAPLTLKLILEFIAYRKLSLEDPETYPPKPNHLAFTYVAVMFLGQVVASVSHGYALWLGRRICVRLRAIIITEVFTKALRRTDSAKAAKALTGVAASFNALDAAPDQMNAEQDQANKADGAAPVEEGVKKDGQAAEDEASEGKILNLVSVDAFSVSEIAAYLLYIFPECPLSIGLSIYFLWRLLGWSAIVGVATLVALLPLQLYLSKLFVRVQKDLLVATDARLDLATEVLSTIRLVKFNAWESKFMDRMQATRKKELRLLARRFFVWTLQGVLSWGTPCCVTVVCFAFHTQIFHAPMPTETAFTALALFNMLRSPLEALTDMIAHVLSAHVSCKRVEQFLAQPETAKYTNLTVSAGPSEPKIGFSGATLSYATEDELAQDETLFCLKKLNLSFPEKELSIIAGSVGSGKTTLLLSLLGETTVLSGKIYMHSHFSRNTAPLDPVTGLSKTVAYCSQQPWLVGASIRENIVFGSPWDEKRYKDTILACQLERDLEIFELGDETEVGEKGTACSGGQKARIALARAVYSRSETVILDDVLSAVDAHTARYLYQRCLKGPLLAGRTVILVTHAVGLCLPGAAYAAVLDNGSVTASGSPADIRKSGVLAEDALVDSGADDDEHHHQPAVALETEIEEIAAPDGALDAEEARKAQEKRAAKKLVKEETSATGGVSLDVYKLYIAAMGTFVFWAILVILFLGSQGIQVETNVWIRKWAKTYDRSASRELSRINLLSFALSPLQHLAQLNGSGADNSQAMFGVVSAAAGPSQDSTRYYLTVYVLISVAYMVSIAVRMSWLFLGSLRASRTLYEQLLHRVLHARVRFFDSTPSGRILNRLSKDIQQVDQEAAPVVMYLITSILSSFAVLLVISLATPAFIFGAIVVVILYWVIGAAYLAISRQLKRIESVSRSPIYVTFAEVLNGMTSIRAYGDSARFTKQCLDLIDNNNAPFLLLWQTNRWLSIYCDVTGALVALFAATFILLNPTLNAGTAGLSLSYAITFTDYVLWVVRMYSALEINLNSVERIREYLVLEPEEAVDAKGIEPPAHWPSRDGKIEVQGLTARYAPEMDPVLKDVTFTVLPREKIGICGRTGSGKSTLALTFFRFMEADSGLIKIDGLDIAKMSLSTLRDRLTIIPQEAQLTSGTIRDNLDPFNQHEDADIWEALIAVRMASWSTPAASRVVSRAPSRSNSVADVAALGDGASAAVSESEFSQVTSLQDGVATGGKNFSSGQRQLLALARGLLKLKSSSILILDESTANLDHASDAAIQEVLREKLGDVTMLVVAHRLRTVIECDKILVLDAGRVVEFGAPVELMAKDGGSFRQLCERSGEMAVLQEMSQAAHQARLDKTEQR